MTPRSKEERRSFFLLSRILVLGSDETWRTDGSKIECTGLDLGELAKVCPVRSR